MFIFLHNHFFWSYKFWWATYIHTYIPIHVTTDLIGIKNFFFLTPKQTYKQEIGLLIRYQQYLSLTKQLVMWTYIAPWQIQNYMLLCTSSMIRYFTFTNFSLVFFGFDFGMNMGWVHNWCFVVWLRLFLIFMFSILTRLEK